MSKDKGTKNVKKAPATTSIKKVSDYKSEGKMAAPIVIVPKDNKAKG